MMLTQKIISTKIPIYCHNKGIKLLPSWKKLKVMKMVTKYWQNNGLDLWNSYFITIQKTLKLKLIRIIGKDHWSNKKRRRGRNSKFRKQNYNCSSWILMITRSRRQVRITLKWTSENWIYRITLIFRWTLHQNFHWTTCQATSHQAHQRST